MSIHSSRSAFDVDAITDLIRSLPGFEGNVSSHFSISEQCNVISFRFKGELKTFKNEAKFLEFVMEQRMASLGPKEPVDDEQAKNEVESSAEKELQAAQALKEQRTERRYLPLDRVNDALPPEDIVQATVNKHRKPDEEFNLGAAEIIDVSDEVEVKEGERAVKVKVEAYGFSLSEIVIGPKEKDHLSYAIDLVEEKTHRLFTMIDALRARGIRIR